MILVLSHILVCDTMCATLSYISLTEVLAECGEEFVRSAHPI